jgi:hypothetical protein
LWFEVFYGADGDGFFADVQVEAAICWWRLPPFFEAAMSSIFGTWRRVGR